MRKVAHSDHDKESSWADGDTSIQELFSRYGARSLPTGRRAPAAVKPRRSPRETNDLPYARGHASPSSTGATTPRNLAGARSRRDLATVDESTTSMHSLLHLKGQRSIAGSIEVFVRVAELGSFRRAAAALQLTPSGVSKCISRLEARLGAALLSRTSREVQLTDEGEMLLVHARRALAEVDAATASLGRAQSRIEGIVRVEAWPFIGQAYVGPALPLLLRSHPALVVQLSLRDPPRVPGQGVVDVSVGLAPPAGQDLVVRSAGTLTGRALLCAAPAYLASMGRPKTVAELRSHRCLGFVSDDEVEPWRLSDVSFLPSGPVLATSKQVLVDAAVRGLGIARLPDVLVAPLLQARALETVLDQHAEVERKHVFVARAAARWVAPRVRTVFGALVQLFKGGNGAST